MQPSRQREQWREATAKYYESKKKAKVDKRIKHPNTPKQQRQRMLWRATRKKYYLKKKLEKPMSLGGLRYRGNLFRAIRTVIKKKEARIRRFEKSFYDADHACKIYKLKLATRLW